MDWLRRNWPDLLIGLALIAVIAGIIATLISGGSFFPAGNRTADDPTPPSTPLTGPLDPGGQPGQTAAAESDSPASGSALDQPSSSATSSVESSAAAGAGAAGAGAAGAAAGDQAQANEQGAAEATSNAGAGATEAAETSASAGSAVPVAVLPPSAAVEEQTETAATAASSAAAESSSVSSSVASSAGSSSSDAIDLTASADADAPYRVSVGAYANRENAERQAATFEAAGYPVFIGTQGDLNIVLVGPYDSENAARSIASQISAADLGVSDPTVYEFAADDEQAVTAVSSGSSASGSSVSSSVDSDQPVSSAAAAVTADDDTVITTAPAATSGVRYLQAGAYGSRESSAPQRERLEGLGFVVTERVESDLIKLLIGPFDATNLQNAQSRLEAAGIASFPR